MPNPIHNLLLALQTKLTNIVLEDGTAPFDRIKFASDLETGYLSKVPETQVLSQEDREFDGENPELGKQTVNLDLFTRDITQRAGEKQIVSDSGLSSCEDAIREEIGHLSGGPFGAGCTLIRVNPPKREDVATKVFRYRVRLIYEIIWG